jgi:DNA-binding transcriptional LysR family regulator
MTDQASWEARIGRRIRLRDLHVLMTVVQSGSMAKAARALSVSQPAVSKAIQDLEAALGVRLLDRGSQGIEPTLYGDVLVRRGAAVFDELRQGVAEIEFIAHVKSGSSSSPMSNPVRSASAATNRCRSRSCLASSGG